MSVNFYSHISAPLAQLEEGLAITLGAKEVPLQDITRHILNAQGKRIRPALFFLALGLWDESPKEHLPVALAIEIIHTATLVHDDVVDKSDKRRGQPSINHIWGNQNAVLTGDYLFAKAFRLLSDYGNVSLIQEMATLVEEMSEGEIMQQAQSFLPELTYEQYFKRISKKTARFFSVCARSAGLVSGAKEQDVLALEAFGFHIGMAFQIIDDLLDFCGYESITGKPQADDLRQGILTLPVLRLLQVSQRKEEFGQRIKNRTIDQALVVEISREIEDYDCANYVRDVALSHVEKANTALDSLPNRLCCESMKLASQYIVKRAN